MDRQFTYPGELVTDLKLLLMQRNDMVGIGHLARAVLGTGPTVAGLACAATSPASMSVTVGTGSIYSLQPFEATAMGSLAADTTDTLVKQAINATAQTFACAAPTTAGESIVYLIEAAYQDYDTNDQALTYFNSTNPGQPYTGPAGNGESQPTVRQGICSLQLVSGVAATTGSQTQPATSSGYSALYTITVPFGATTITSANIAVVSGAPFIPYTLPQLGNMIGAGVAPGTATGKVVTVTSNTAITVMVATLAMSSGTGNVSEAVSATINTSTTGLGGMDIGSAPASSWLYVWGVSNGSTSGALLSTSSTNPTLPSGYTYKGLISEVRTDASGYLMRTITRGKRTQYVLTAGTSTTSYPAVASNLSDGTYAQPVAVFVPPDATVFHGTAYLGPSTASVSYLSVAPDNTIISAGGSANLQIGNPVYLSSTDTAGATVIYPFSFVLNSADIYIFIGGGASTNAISCLGWESV